MIRVILSKRAVCAIVTALVVYRNHYCDSESAIYFDKIINLLTEFDYD